MPTPVTGHNLHSVWSYSQPLGVECRSCSHRACAFAGQVEDLRGNMRELRTLRFVCSRCGSTDWQGWLLRDDDDRRLFLSQGTAGPTFA